MRLHPRVERLEAQQTEKHFVPAMTFIWAGGQNDVDLEEAKRQVEAKCCDLIVIHLVPPYQANEDPGIKTGVQDHGLHQGTGQTLGSIDASRDGPQRRNSARHHR